MSPSRSVCRQCGLANRPEFRFCIYCHQPVSTGLPSRPRAPQAPAPLRSFRIPARASRALALGLAGVTAFGIAGIQRAAARSAARTQAEARTPVMVTPVPALPAGLSASVQDAGRRGANRLLRVRVVNRGPRDADAVTVRIGLYDARGKYSGQLVAPLFHVSGGSSAEAVCGYDATLACRHRVLAAGAQFAAAPTRQAEAPEQIAAGRPRLWPRTVGLTDGF